MNRLFFISLLLLAPVTGHAGAFMFPEDNEEAPAPVVRPAPATRPAVVSKAPDDDGPVKEDYSLFTGTTKRVSRPSAVSPNGRGLLSPARTVAQGYRISPSRPVTRGHSHGDGHNHSYESDDEETEGNPPCIGCKPDGKSGGRYVDVASVGRIRSTPANMRAAVWAPFASKFAQCAPGCEPAQVGVHRDSGGRSCHDFGRAVDVGAMICGGRVYKAINGGRFSRMVSCMRPKIKTLYQEGHKRYAGVTQAHYDHAHFSIGCHGGTYW